MLPPLASVASAAAEPLPPPVPFVVLFESSSGSSWLMSELAAHPQLCVVQFEPIDNITMASAADHAARIRWLSTLWAPQRADGGLWARWKSALVAASVFGQLPAIEASLARCNRTAAVAFGLKARLSRLLSHEPSLQQLAALMAVRGVRVVQLSRRNRVKQALAEYRRLHAGLGQFRAAPAPPPGSTTYRKATPDRLCEAVSNYAELCAKYRKSDLAQFFTEPCSTPCRARADRTG